MLIAPMITTTGITALGQSTAQGAARATYPSTAISAKTSAHISVSTWLVRRNAAFSQSRCGPDSGAYCAVKGVKARDPQRHRRQRAAGQCGRMGVHPVAVLDPDDHACDGDRHEEHDGDHLEQAGS